jgi:hypothetical protein
VPISIPQVAGNGSGSESVSHRELDLVRVAPFPQNVEVHEGRGFLGGDQVLHGEEVPPMAALRNRIRLEATLSSVPNAFRAMSLTARPALAACS